MRLFEITRADGRSNTQVLLDYVREGEPGRIYTYDELSAVLSAGTDRQYTHAAVGNAVRNALHALERTHKRALHNVRLRGYRMAHAKEHMGLAVIREDKALRQRRMAVHTLKHVRWEELDPNTRQLHEATLMLVGSLYAQQQAMERRMRAVEAAILTVK
jgi:hypothetical protein